MAKKKLYRGLRGTTGQNQRRKRRKGELDPEERRQKHSSVSFQQPWDESRWVGCPFTRQLLKYPIYKKRQRTHTHSQTYTKEMSNTLTHKCSHQTLNTCGKPKQTTEVTRRDNERVNRTAKPAGHLNNIYVSHVCVSTWWPCSVYSSLPSTRSRTFIVESLDAVIRKLPAGWKDKLFTTPLWTGKHKHTHTHKRRKKKTQSLKQA